MISRLFSRSKSTAKTANFRPMIEDLEGRITPAAALTTSQSGSTLTLTGTSADNEITLSGDGIAGHVDVYETGGINGKTSFTGITSIKVALGAGTNSLYVLNVNIGSNLTVAGGAGGDFIFIGDGTKITGTTNIATYGGNDLVQFYTHPPISPLTLGAVTLSLGAGDDEFDLYGATINGFMNVDMGAGNDYLYLGYLSPTYGTVNLNYGVSAVVPSASINMGDGNDYFFYDYASDAAPSLAGLVVVKGGSGTNFKYLGSSNPLLSLSGFSNIII